MQEGVAVSSLDYHRQWWPFCSLRHSPWLIRISSDEGSSNKSKKSVTIFNEKRNNVA